jgi:hypothetical protein
MTNPVTTTDPTDYRLADFKVLLPLRADLRVLVIDVAEPAFARHLAADVGSIDAMAIDTAMAHGAAAGRPGLYDLVFSDGIDAARYVRDGGTFCHFSQATGAAAPVPGFQLLGRWRALPDWPAFRALVPDHASGWYAAVRHLRLLSLRSLGAMLALLRSPWASRCLPARAITLYRRPGHSAPTLLAEIEAGFNEIAAANTEATLTQWLPVSGRLGPGNPILVFRLDKAGKPVRLIKLARVAGAEHLYQEAAKLELVEGLLGDTLAARMIRPDALATCHGRAALAYTYVPTHTFYGLRWQLQARHNYCLAMTRWLADCATVTRQQLDGEANARLHLDPLRRLLARRILPAAAQAQAQLAAAWLQAQPQLPTVLEHGDLGIYNTRLTCANGTGFQVLDWGSSTEQGIATGDLVYLLVSARAPVALTKQCLLQYLAHLSLPVAMAAPLWFSYLARRWEELDTVRPPDAGDPASGGGLLLSVHARAQRYLDSLES